MPGQAGSTFTLPGVKPKAYFKSLTLSLQVSGSKPGVHYHFSHDEPVGVYIDADIAAFRSHGDLIETDEDGNQIAPPGGVPEQESHLSYRRYAPPGAPSISPADLGGKGVSGSPATRPSGNPGSQTAVPPSKTPTQNHTRQSKAHPENLSSDPEVRAFEERRKKQLDKLKGEG